MCNFVLIVSQCLFSVSNERQLVRKILLLRKESEREKEKELICSVYCCIQLWPSFSVCCDKFYEEDDGEV